MCNKIITQLDVCDKLHLLDWFAVKSKRDTSEWDEQVHALVAMCEPSKIAKLLTTVKATKSFEMIRDTRGAILDRVGVAQSCDAIIEMSAKSLVAYIVAYSIKQRWFPCDLGSLVFSKSM